MLNWTLKQAWRVVVAVVGFTIGIAMLLLPGPGLLVIAVGLGILGAEFVWARRLLRRVKRAGQQVVNSLFGADAGQRAGGGSIRQPSRR
jgi:Flp pilus assembly protein TadB